MHICGIHVIDQVIIVKFYFGALFNKKIQFLLFVYKM